MGRIFSYEDSSYDRIELRAGADSVDLAHYGDSSYCSLDRGAVRGLRDALTAWLRDGVPEPAGLTEERVREIVAEELDRVLFAPGRIALEAVPVTVNDPSPRDAGHAEDIWGPPCNGCTHSTGVHVSSGCTNLECGCTRMSGECAQPSAPALCECGHSERVHAALNGGCTRCECALDRDRCTP